MWVYALVAFAAPEQPTDLTGADESSQTRPDAEVPDVERAIVDGEPAGLDDYPAAGGLLAVGTVGDLEGHSFVCSSTLIAPDVVLTAAHCTNIEAELGISLDAFWWVYTRQVDLTEHGLRFDHEVPEDGVASIDWVAHPDYDQGGVGPRDFALVFLETPIYDVPYAWVVTVEEDETIAVGDQVTAVGWGLQDGETGSVSDGTSQVKQMGTGPLAVEQRRWLKWRDAGVQVCSGDSGGGLYQEFPDGRRVVGVTSTGDIHCTQQSNFVRVASDLDWIEQELVQRCEDGTRSWCWTDGLPDPANPPLDPDTGDTGDTALAAEQCGCGGGAIPAGLWLIFPLLWRRRCPSSPS